MIIYSLIALHILIHVIIYLSMIKPYILVALHILIHVIIYLENARIQFVMEYLIIGQRDNDLLITMLIS